MLSIEKPVSSGSSTGPFMASVWSFYHIVMFDNRQKMKMNLRGKCLCMWHWDGLRWSSSGSPLVLGDFEDLGCNANIDGILKSMQCFYYYLLYRYKERKKNLKKLTLLLIKDALNWSKVTVKTLKMLQKISVSNKCCSFELSINQIIVKKFNNGRSY